jgi:hypothetical protein
VSGRSSLWVAGAVLVCGAVGRAQQAVVLPEAKPSTQAVEHRFEFASDGPVGPGWTRPDAIARVYFKGELPALFRRTLQLAGDVPERTRLEWIFTGPHAGLTVELTSSKVRLVERFYDSTALNGGGNYPEKTVREEEQQYVGHARALTVVVDAHLSVQVLVNEERVLTAPLLFDLTRQQLMFSGPRNEHLTLAGGLLAETPQEATVTVNAAKVHQEMLGFGGSPSVPAYAELSDEGKRMYWQILKRYNLLVDREYPMGTQLKQDLSNVEDLKDATPHYYGDNFPNGEVSDFDYSKRTRELGGMVLYEMWALPEWAIQAYTPEGKPAIDAWGKPVKRAARPDVYAREGAEWRRAGDCGDSERGGAAAGGVCGDDDGGS